MDNREVALDQAFAKAYETTGPVVNKIVDEFVLAGATDEDISDALHDLMGDVRRDAMLHLRKARNAQS